MTKFSALQTIAAACVAIGVCAHPAQAASGRTFVSGLGSDSGTACSRTAPCRTFQHAHDNTSPYGEIVVLDAAGYGPVTITQSISIVQDGVGEAETSGVIITAGASDVIHLRGLTVDGHYKGTDGIMFTSGGSLTVANCVVREFGGTGIDITPTTNMNFLISNTIVSDNNNRGLQIAPQAGSIIGVVDRVVSDNNAIGIFVATDTVAADVLVTNSTISNNSNGGIGALGAKSVVTIRNTAASGNYTGFYAEFGASLYLAHSVATLNHTGVLIDINAPIGVIYTFVDNDIKGNTTTDVSGTLTTVAQQ